MQNETHNLAFSLSLSTLPLSPPLQIIMMVPLTEHLPWATHHTSYCWFSQSLGQVQGYFMDEAPEMKRNYTACPEPSSGQAAEPWVKPMSLWLVSFPFRSPVLLCCAWSLFLVCSLLGYMVLCQGFGSLPVPSLLPLSQSSRSEIPAAATIAKHLEGNMLFLDDKPQGAINSHCHHTRVV